MGTQKHFQETKPEKKMIGTGSYLRLHQRNGDSGTISDQHIEHS